MTVFGERKCTILSEYLAFGYATWWDSHTRDIQTYWAVTFAERGSEYTSTFANQAVDELHMSHLFAATMHLMGGSGEGKGRLNNKEGGPSRPRYSYRPILKAT